MIKSLPDERLKDMAITTTITAAKAGAGAALRAMLCFALILLVSMSWGPAPMTWPAGGTAGSASPYPENHAAGALAPSRDTVRNGWADRNAFASRLSAANGDDLPAGLPSVFAQALPPAGFTADFVFEDHALHPVRFVRPGATGPPAAL
ncbi:hypothetical protein [Parvibaculum sp.]|uniref:hypothetical protein n=1 Tax=Parvibaculum sp. TaxID=2024848 RepID=UPI001DD45B28|nr:hypothetical protein [Parvibaculum sp.]MBX3488127.1 hypothetical protein [Parvibaculum sp.]MCW5727895.1 hypothetical protein [Parvibaculum sp.]